MTELLIRGASVIDGSGGPARRADVAIEGGRIARVLPDGHLGDAARVVDAGGLALAPGFIDMHSHADFTLPSYPDAINSLAQGVTTEVVGNCGYSPAPLARDRHLADDQRAAGRGLGPDLDWEWRSFGEYLDRLQAAEPAVNCIPLVGHGMLRMAVVGAEDRAASPSELDRMRAATAQALADGAWGMSTGLVYPPGSYADTDEIVAVGTALRHVDGLYASHIRNETDGLAEALREAIEIGRRLGVRVEVSHLKAAGRVNHGRGREALAILDEARASGVRVHQDAYPYLAGSTLLTQLVPPWVHDGGTDALVERLRSPAMRDRIAADVRDGLPGWPNYVAASGGWEEIRIAAVADPALASLEGVSIARAASARGVDPLSLALDTMAADRGATTMIVSLMADDDVDAIIGHPSTSIGSDQLGVTARGARVHPRSYGTFVRVLARCVRERGLLDLPTAIHRMTGMPAATLGLTDRGRIEAGAVADLVLFDPATVADAATYDDPTAAAVGVEGVLLAGVFAVEGGQPVRPALGRVLRPDVSGRRPPLRSG
ncbi:MAG: D-aminoacylase [Chloroflexi bacterium]|nr:D-aminoacylase [Chloroflexota bacterium]